MAKGERIVFTNDLDGIHFKAPLPIKTTLQLLRGKELVPSEQTELQTREAGNGLASRFSILFHLIRPFNGDTVQLFHFFRDAALAYEREMRIAILSGREAELHELTRRRLEGRGLGRFINDYYLNDSDSSSGWKEAKVRELLEEGCSVVHIDDDPKPAFRIARLNEQVEDSDRVLVYLMGNASNHPILLRRAGLELPQNVVRIASFREAGVDFARRLRQGKF